MLTILSQLLHKDMVVNNTRQWIFGNRVQLPDSLFHINRYELIPVCLICVLILIRNLSLAISGFGEQDAARIFNDAIMWHHLNALPFSGYRERIVPGYLMLIKAFLDYGVAIDDIIRTLNNINIFIGVLTIFVSYFLFRVFLPASLSIVCVTIYAFVPSIFFASIYGFPTLIAYTSFLISLLLFIRSTITCTKISALHWFFAVIALCMATVLKADIIILASSYFGLLVIFGRTSISALASALLLTMAGTIAPIAFKYFMLPSTVIEVDTLSFMQTWNDRFPIDFVYLVSKSNIAITVRSVGPVFFGLSLLGAIVAAIRHEARRFVWLILISTLPLVLFWGLREGNSARHMIGLALPAVLLIGILFYYLNHKRQSYRVLFSVCALSILLNYFVLTPSSSTVSPSSRLLESAILLREEVSARMNLGETIPRNPQTQHFLVDGFLLPYSLHNVLRETKSIEEWSSEGKKRGALKITFLDGRQASVAWAYISNRDEAIKLVEQKRDEGITVWSEQYSEN